MPIVVASIWVGIPGRRNSWRLKLHQHFRHIIQSLKKKQQQKMNKSRETLTRDTTQTITEETTQHG